MSDKPSLYVVEKKEVVILVVLFVLVTVLSFTLGVRYGEAVGKKSAREQEHAAEEHGGGAGEGGGGTLGKVSEKQEGHAEETKPADKAAADTHAEPHADPHAAPAEAKADAHGEAKANHSPEAAAKTPSPSISDSAHEAVDKNSDEYLLNALKDAGVEPPGGKAPKDAKLPAEVKAGPKARNLSGTYVIQVGSHPTKAEADSQVRQLKARKVNAEILQPFKDKQGEWHRVVVGSFKNKREADREASSLKAKGSIGSFFVWRLP